jgi:aminomethyltransferase
MPVQFSGTLHEHQTIREKVGMFDISHMGKFTVVGNSAIKALQALVPSDLQRLAPGSAQYTMLLNPTGGIIDDIIVYNEGEGRVVVIANAGRKNNDRDWLLAQLDANAVTFADLSDEYALLAIQGPQAIATLQPHCDINLADLPFFGHARGNILGNSAFIARTGYTGEDGVEVMILPAAARQLWQALADGGVTPCGLGARDTLRLEAAMCLYGQDIDETTTPLEAGLGWTVHLDTKGDFIGKEVLMRQKAAGVSRKLVGIATNGRHIARHDYPIVIDGQQVGKVTSGTLSPTLGTSIALGYVPIAASKIGTSLEIEIRGKLYPANVVKKPFYSSPSRKN